MTNLLDDEKPEIESISSSSEGSSASDDPEDDPSTEDDQIDDGPKFTGHGLIGLAHQFESYFKERDPILFKHLIQIGSHPVRIAFRWLIRAGIHAPLGASWCEIFSLVLVRLGCPQD